MDCKNRGVPSFLAHAVLSVMALVLALRILSSLLMPSPGDPTAFRKRGNVAGANSVLLERSNSIDVLFIGDSEAYASYAVVFSLTCDDQAVNCAKFAWMPVGYRGNHRLFRCRKALRRTLKSILQQMQLESGERKRSWVSFGVHRQRT